MHVIIIIIIKAVREMQEVQGSISRNDIFLCTEFSP